MFEVHSFPPSDDVKANAKVTADQYADMYAHSVNDPDAFWAEHGKRIDWIKPYTKISDVNYNIPDVSIKWFEDGTLNAAANCIDRHLATRGDQVAIIWEGDDPKDDAKIT